MIFKCGVCGKNFKNKKTLEKHFFIEHFAQIQDDRDTLEELQEFNDLQNRQV